MERRKEYISLYKKPDIRSVYFAAGLAYCIGSVAGGTQGLLFTLRRTLGKPRAMAYFVTDRARELADRMSTSAAALALAQFGISFLERILHLGRPEISR